MAEPDFELLTGEFPRLLDDRFRLSIPAELAELLTTDGECVIAKERPGCLSLWSKPQWQAKLDAGVELVTKRLQAGKLEGRIEQVQLLGRLLSTRHRDVKIAGKGRIVIPEGFRQFLGVEQGGEVIVVGAAVCVELWRPDAWLAYLEERLPEFRKLFEELM